jgi:pimeloyl-ACP methyl ester carboxylesterase
MQIDVDGRKAYAYTGGKAFDPTLPCALFMHGALHDHSVWTLLARWAAHHGYATLAVDQPGHWPQRRAAPGQRRGARPTGRWRCWMPPTCSRPRWSAIAWARLIALEAASRAPQRVSRLVDDRHRLPDEGVERAAGHGSREPA